MAAIAGLNGSDHPQLMLKGTWVVFAHSRADEGLRVHALDSDVAPKHLREYQTNVMARQAVRPNKLIGRSRMEVRLYQNQSNNIGDILKSRHRLASVLRPGQPDGECKPGGQQMLFEVTFCLVLYQVGGDGVKYRAEHKNGRRPQLAMHPPWRSLWPARTVQGRPNIA